MERVNKKLLSTSSSLLESKQKLEKEMKKLYDIQGWEAENKVVRTMKTNIKAFFAYGMARQKKVGPFLDPNTGIPNPDPDYAAHILSEQYSSVFTTPRAESSTKVGHFSRMFSKLDINMTCRELKSNSSPGPDGVPAVY